MHSSNTMETALEIRRKRRIKKSIRVNPFLLQNVEKTLKKYRIPFTHYVEHLMLNDYKNNFEILKKRKKSLF